MGSAVFARVKIIGTGHAVGSKVVSNRDASIRLGLSAQSLEERTGIFTRHVSGEGQTVITLAAEAVSACFADAGLTLGRVGAETVLLYIQNGLTHLTPPAGILLADQLKTPKLRVLSLDGVCSEPIHALEIAGLMLSARRCEQVIICAAADFISAIDETDEDTAGLFGSGAGALLLRSSAESETGAIDSLGWETDASHWDLGTISVSGISRRAKGVTIEVSYYKMRGIELARVAVRHLEELVRRVLKEAGWSIEDIDHVACHQPNPKMMEIGARKLGVPFDRFILPGKTMGNMGPASVLIALSLLKQQGALVTGSRILAVSFGLGFSCGCAAITV
jgi:3-oxoacyl-[acyl-carrier-protein] synthase-3